MLSISQQSQSLASRLVLSATLFCGGALLLTGILLVSLFRQHVEHRFDSVLRHDLVHLVSTAKISKAGSIQIDESLSDVQFTQPFSGWAWQIRSENDILKQSRSLGPMVRGVMEKLEAPRDAIGEFVAPGSIMSRGLSREIRLNGTNQPLTFAIAYPQLSVDNSLVKINRLALISLIALGIGLVATNIILMRLALKPLGALRSKVVKMREGSQQDPVAWPRELQPIADELEILQAHVTRLVERARGQASDLAHAVKTPLAVLRQLENKCEPSVAEPLRAQVDRIGAYLDRHLGRNRAAGAAFHQVDVKTVVEDILFALSHDLTDRGINLQVSIQEGIRFVGDEADFYELVGNILDNASKWARACIEIKAEVTGDRLCLEVADDGPGVPTDQRHRIFARGTRLDQATDGQGLGLTIVRDIAALYQSEVKIGGSHLGGAAVSLRLPGGCRAEGA